MGNNKPTVSFLGPQGTYSHQAAQKLFSKKGNLQACANFDEVFSVLEKREVEYAVIPIENNTAGLVDAAFELLIDSSFSILGEFDLPIVHSLLSKEEDFKDIDQLFSLHHPYHQSSLFIKKNLAHVHWVQSPSSTQALKDCLAQPKRTAAIGFADTGIELGLNVLARGIQDIENNRTRFVLIAAESKKLPDFCKGKSQKSTIIFNLEDKPGSLLRILQIFQDKGLNLCHIESRPMKTGEWQYKFYLTIEGQKGLSEALELVRESTPWFKSLGTYPIIST